MKKKNKTCDYTQANNNFNQDVSAQLNTDKIALNYFYSLLEELLELLCCKENQFTNTLNAT